MDVTTDTKTSDSAGNAGAAGTSNGSSGGKTASARVSGNGSAKAGTAPSEEVPADGAAGIAAAAAESAASAESAADDTSSAETATLDTSVIENSSFGDDSDASDTTNTLGMVDVPLSERPRGNVYDVNDVYSAPPMPSETIPPGRSTPSASSVLASPAASSASSASAASGSPSSSAARAATSSPLTESAPPTFAYPRTGTPAQKPAGKSDRSAASRAIPRPKASVRRSGGRQAHLTIARVEPWSVMKFSFVISLIAFVILLVAIMLLYGLLSALGVFDSLQHLVSNVTSSQSSAGVNAKSWFSASRVFTYTVALGVINLILITALSTVGAVIYNLTSRLVGGIEVTLKESD